jgi:peptide-methionine (S)-S-oxide reductase
MKASCILLLSAGIGFLGAVRVFSQTHSTNTLKSNMTTNSTELATFGGGCFWCSEAVFQGVKGVKSVTSGYAGGHTPNPTYQQVCGGDTGHAEVIQIAFDPREVSYERLVELFWEAHDPTTLNRQGADTGTQYRSIILYSSERQKQIAEASKQHLAARSGRAIVTEIVPLTRFYPAEEYHWNYYRNNSNAPYCRMVIRPKLEKLAPKIAKP